MKHRKERLEEEIRETLSEIVVNSLSDPRLPTVFNVTRVDLTKDLRIARVYFTQQPDGEDEIDETIAMLEHAHGYLRTELAQQVTFRHVPELEFYYDEEGRARERIEQLLEEARKGSTNQD